MLQPVRGCSPQSDSQVALENREMEHRVQSVAARSSPLLSSFMNTVLLPAAGLHLTFTLTD